MLLQADPTVQYALGKHVARVYYKDLEIDSPYNTYKYKGLPPGPIASPGRPSIEAALYPANVPYEYFVAFPDGHHEFRADLAGHEKAKLEARRAWDSLEVGRRGDCLVERSDSRSPAEADVGNPLALPLGDGRAAWVGWRAVACSWTETMPSTGGKSTRSTSAGSNCVPRPSAMTSSAAVRAGAAPVPPPVGDGVEGVGDRDDARLESGCCVPRSPRGYPVPSQRSWCASDAVGSSG